MWASLPMILFAVIAFMAGALVFKLPETVKRKIRLGKLNEILC